MQATREIGETLGDLSPYDVTVRAGVYTLPALVDRDQPWVCAFFSTGVRDRGRELETVYTLASFDAGMLCSRGIPAVTYGAGSGVWPLGDDFVPIASMEAEAATLLHLIMDQLGGAPYRAMPRLGRRCREPRPPGTPTPLGSELKGETRTC
jgi:hypothetical protein